MKQITVFGASGNIGSRVAARLLAKGYVVIAFVRGNHNFEAHDNLRIFSGDIYNAEQVAQALQGSDVVVSTLGSWGTPKKDILSAGMRNIIPAMEQQGIRRIITLTGSDARDSEDRPNLVQRIAHSVFGLVVGKIIQDGETHLALLRQSTLDFTTLRSPVMTDGGKKGSYVLRNRLPGITEATVARDDVASALVELVESPKFIRQAPVIYRR